MILKGKYKLKMLLNRIFLIIERTTFNMVRYGLYGNKMSKICKPASKLKYLNNNMIIT